MSFRLRTLKVFPFQSLVVTEYRYRFFERDAMLFQVNDRFPQIQVDHNYCIYNKFPSRAKGFVPTDKI